MLFILFLLLLCGCAQTGRNTFPRPESVRASVRNPFMYPDTLPARPKHSPPAPIFSPARVSLPQTQASSPKDQASLPSSQAPFSKVQVSLPRDQAPFPKNQTLLPKAGLATVENLVCTALEPVGSTMYVWGGGWNKTDTGAGPEALSIGCSKRWAEFTAAQGSDYNHHSFRYRNHDGLDCSGYIGWILYNLFHTENSQSENDGYVMKSTAMAKTFADYGWGRLIPASEAAEWKPGDICSMSGHVWLSLGMCRDGSVLLLHSSPPGVRICGTVSGDNKKTDAVKLAEKWMSDCYPEWHAKYPKCSVNDSYLKTSDIMRWNNDTLEDAERFQAMTAEEVAAYFMPGNPS